MAIPSVPPYAAPDPAWVMGNENKGMAQFRAATVLGHMRVYCIPLLDGRPHPTRHDIRGYSGHSFVNFCECQIRDQFRRLWLSNCLGTLDVEDSGAD